MKTGWLVVNHFLATAKFTEHYQWLKEAASRRGISLLLKTGCDLLGEKGRTEMAEKPDFVLFWDKDVRLAAQLEKAGLRLYNNARAIALCDDKSLTQLMLEHEIAMPKTVIAPMTYPSVGYPDLSFAEQAIEELGLPLVIKECFGSFGQQVYLAKTEEEVKAYAQRLAGTPFLFQEFISTSFGRDVRLQVVGNRVIASMLRHNESGDFRANITGGAAMSPYEPTQEMVSLALYACGKLKLDFAGVDFMFGPQGEPILCEINSNAHFKNLYDCTVVNAAEAIIEWIDSQTE